MKKSIRIAAAAAAALLVLAGGSARAAGALTGAGYTPSHCEPPILVTVNGVEAAEGTWTFDVAAVNAENTVNDPFTFCDFVPALSLVFSGAWDPAVGGCIPVVALDALIGDMNLCLLDPQPQDDTSTTYGFTVCDRPIEECAGDTTPITLTGATL